MIHYGSVCSGIEAASSAWHPLGWQASFFSEIEPFPRAVLSHHYPHVPLHGDFTTIEASQYAAIDVLVGGTPCQSFSVAGLRAGLADQRGNLALEFCRLARRLGPKWVVWENVPGVLSLDGGRAFASILGGLAECGYGLAYRVLDAQFVRVDGFGRAVPQRRRRVFVVGCLGSWQRAAAVLFERQSLRRDTPPRREAGERPAATLGTSSARRRGLDDRGDAGANIIAHTLNAKGGAGRIDSESESESETFLAEEVAHALRADGFDASEDGTGRGTPLVPKTPYTLAIRGRGDTHNLEYRQDGVANAVLTPNGGRAGIGVGAICFDETQITSAEKRCNPQPGDPCHPLAKGARAPTIAFSAKDHGADAMNDLSPTLRAGGFTTSHANAGVMPAVLTGWRVRRLTPVECERLQGFPDGYTDVPYRGKRAADGPRYKALGNSMACNVMRWIGRRIEMVDQIIQAEKENRRSVSAPGGL